MRGAVTLLAFGLTVLPDPPYKISRANRKKLARLKKITVTIRAYVTMATGKTLKPQQTTRTIYRKLGVGQQLNSNGTTNDGI